MEFIRPLLIFLGGVVAAGVFFVSGLEHRIPPSLRFWREEPIELAIVPSGYQGDCPPNYAIDNRTDQPVFFTLADSPNTYPLPDRDRDRDSDRYSPYPRASNVDFESAAGTGLDALSNPESAEPGVNAPDDFDPGDSNYGGSSAEYGGLGYNPDSDERFRSPDDYSNDYRNGYEPPPQPSGDLSAGPNSYAPPPSGQPIPLTPQENSSPYGAPPPPPNGAPPSPPIGSGPPGPTYGGLPTRVRPGEIYFASSNNAFGACNGYGSTVTLQFNE